MRAIPKDFSAVYFCPTCHKFHATEAEARACFASTPPPKAKVGDVILLYPQYGWFDGSEDWVVKTNVKHHARRLYAFWYVVVAIEETDQHRQRYYLRTRACEQAQGYTYDEHHHWVWEEGAKHKPPQSVLQGAWDLIGEKVDRLL